MDSNSRDNNFTSFYGNNADRYYCNSTGGASYSQLDGRSAGKRQDIAASSVAQPEEREGNNSINDVAGAQELYSQSSRGGDDDDVDYSSALSHEDDVYCDDYHYDCYFYDYVYGYGYFVWWVIPMSTHLIWQWVEIWE